MSSRALLALLLGTACQFSQANDTGFSSAPDVELTARASTGGDSGGSTSSDGEDTSSGNSSTNLSTGEPDTTSDTSGQVPDVGQSGDTGDRLPVGCQGKIDFLFVISNDGVMMDLQPRLMASLPKFIATIEEKFVDFDYHIMVTDSDSNWGNSTCDEQCTDAGVCEYVPEYPCDKLNQVEQCDRMLGAGSVFTAGCSAYSEPCTIAGGKRYLTREQPDLAKTFQCIAQVGSGGDGKMGEALAAAMSTQLGGIGGCNDGFLRNDALLMVTLIGSWDVANALHSSEGTPEEWAQAIVAKKHGNLEAVVMLDIGSPDFPWQDRIWQLTKMFKYGLVTDLDDLDYGLAFDAATNLAVEACTSYAPPA